MSVITFAKTEIGMDSEDPFTISVKPYDSNELVLIIRAGDGDSEGDQELSVVFPPNIADAKRLIKNLQHAERAVRAWKRAREKETW
jgi:hypothetical protein